MKKKKRLFLLSGIVFVFAFIFLVTTFVQTMITVEASSMMPGIETIIGENSKEHPLRILEITEDEKKTELGYYVAGEEPYIKNYTYDGKTFSSLEEGLKAIANEEERKAFAEAKDYLGQISNMIGDDPEKYPLTYEQYQEKYFLNGSDNVADWKEVTLDKRQVAKIKGVYESNKEKTGDYTKGEQNYYPIREDVASDQDKVKYRENIASFSYTEGMGAVSPYNIEFEAVDSGQIEQWLQSDPKAIADEYEQGYGFYINDYRILTDTVDKTMFPGEDNSDKILVYRAVPIQGYPHYRYEPLQNQMTLEEVEKAVVSNPTKEGDITKTKGTYYYWSDDGTGKLVRENLYYIQGKEPITYKEVLALSNDLPSNYEYYYKVKNVLFACRLGHTGNANDPESYEYYGWYYPNYRSGEEQYILVDETTKDLATYYISDEEYHLTKGTGDYDFVPDENAEEVAVEVDHFYYQGGFINNEWLKKYVFHLDPGDGSIDSSLSLEEKEEAKKVFDQFDIKITATTARKLESMSKSQQKTFLKDYDLIYIHDGINEEVAQVLSEDALQKEYACIIRMDTMTEKEKETIKATFSYYYDDSDSDKNYVKDNVYFVSVGGSSKGYGIFDNDLNKSIVDINNATALKNSGFQEIMDYIEEENIYRNIEGLEEIEEIVSRAKVIEYILNFQYKRVTVEKKELNILELEPAISDGSVTQQKVANWLGIDLTTSGIKINIKRMTTSEFIGKIEDINGIYDLIYIGDNYQKAISLGASVWGITTPNTTLVYSHTGGQFTRSNKFAGMLDTENANISTVRIPTKMSGNDLTKRKMEELQEFVKSGYPIIIATGLVNGNKINETKVDNSSNMYELLTDLLPQENVLVENKIDKNTLAFYTNLEKPKILFEKNGQPPSAIGDTNGPSNEYLKKNELEYRFSIQHNSAASMTSATYHCELFVDLNADGVFSEGENSAENLRDIKIYDAYNNQVLKGKDGKYHLKVNTQYYVTRTIPDNYYKLIQWKLQITSNLENGQYIRASETGYTKKETPEDKKPTVKVLQIHSDLNKSNYRPSWILTEDPNYYLNYIKKYNLPNKYNTSYKDTEFFNLIRSYVKDFNVDITTMDVNEYANYYLGRSVDTSVTTAGQDWLSQFDMVIVGFADMQDDIPTPKDSKTGEVLTYPDEEDGGKIVNRNPVEGLVTYIENGNSVLFTHDTTSFTNHQQTGAGLSNLELKWGYNLNSIMRPLVGMDRYGIKSNKVVEETGETIGSILKKGLALQGDELKKVETYANDVVYVPGSKRTKAYPDSHGYSSGILDYLTGVKTTTATQVNEGSITEYPFKIDKTLSVSSTHAQYYQLDLEADDDGDGMNDIVVWYCLNGGRYGNFPNDVRNLYYLYSKGNVLYTGVGHSKVNKTMEKKLFINAIVAAWRAGKSEPEVKFVEEFKVNSNEQTVKYYSTDENKQSAVGNIINNNLELYVTIDDIKMIPGNSENTSSDLEIEFYISDPNGSVVSGLGEEPVKKIKVDSVVKKINSGTAKCEQTADGSWKVESGNVYQVLIDDITQYVETGNGYETPTIYAKVTSNYQYYGKREVSSGYAKVKLWRRQIFDLD